VAAELAATGAPYAVFVDNNLGSNRRYLRALYAALAPLDKIWSAAITLDVTDEPDLVRQMALAGCTGVFIGFESLTDDNIRAAGKRAPRAETTPGGWRCSTATASRSMAASSSASTTIVPRCSRTWRDGSRTTAWSARPFTSSRLTRTRRSTATSRPRERLLHEDWSRYDTAHCVFRPRHMSPADLEAGYAWIYRRLFSFRSIWRRRPTQTHAVLPYLGMALLYKRSNWLWKLLIRHRLTHAVWAPLVQLTRLRHLRYRSRLARDGVLPGHLISPLRPSV
jgi:hypothetical protein